MMRKFVDQPRRVFGMCLEFCLSEANWFRSKVNFKYVFMAVGWKMPHADFV